MKKHNTFKVVLITILVFMLLTWILPAAYYSSGYVDQGRVQMWLIDLFNYPIIFQCDTAIAATIVVSFYFGFTVIVLSFTIKVTSPPVSINCRNSSTRSYFFS